jgi:hypothetical protein
MLQPKNRGKKKKRLPINNISHMICDFLHTKCHIPISNSPLVITIKMKKIKSKAIPVTGHGGTQGCENS